jgi:hypothetical protein
VSRPLRTDSKTDWSDRAGGPTYFAAGRTSTPSRFCSRMCADQPAVREHANIAGASDGGISATSSTIADQNSTFVYEWSGCFFAIASCAACSSASATSTRGEPSSLAVRFSRRERGSSAR